MAEKRIIGFDLDDVLLNFNDTLRPYHNTKFGTNYDRKHVTTFGLQDVWGVTKEEAVERILGFFHSSEHWNALPVEGAVEGIIKLKVNNSLFVVTAKPEELRDKTVEWLGKHFPEMFDKVIFTNHFHGVGKKRPKSEVCKEFKIEIFVDDSIENAFDIANSDIPVLLLDTPWNQGEIKPLITRVYSWDEIV